MTFDQYGHLTPYAIIETDLSTIEQAFVKEFPESATRSAIFTEYLAYLNHLKSIIGATGFYQWMDGSFITQVQQPNDIDVITFVDWQIHRQYGSRLEVLRTEKVDSNYGIHYPTNHKYHPLYLYEREDWIEIFGSTKDGKYPKGIIQINF